MTNSQGSQPGENKTNLQRKAHYIIIRFHSRNNVRQERVEGNTQNIQREDHQQRVIYPAKLSFTYEGEVKAFPNKN